MRNQCEFCQAELNTKPVSKKLRGEVHTFCSEGCYILWRYDRPRCRREFFYPSCANRVEPAVAEKVLER